MSANEAGEHTGQPSRKILKYAPLALAGLMLVLGAAIAYVAATFDPRDYQQHIVNLVREKTGRMLEIQGEVALSFWPDVGVRLGALSLSERGSTERFADVESARLTLKLMPLLSRELVASELVIAGAQVRITRYEDGKLNIDDLLKGEGGPPRFDIGRLVIERSALTYRDLATGAQYELTEIKLETGRLSDGVTTPVALAMVARDVGDVGDDFRLSTTLKAQLDLGLAEQRYALTRARLELKGRVPGMADLAVRASGDAVVRLQSGELQLSALVASMSGTRGQEQIEVTLGASKLHLVAGEARGEAVRATLLAKGPAGSTDAKLDLPSVQRHADRIGSASAALDLQLQRGEHSIRAAVSTPLEASIAARELAMTDIAANFTASGPRLPRKGLAGAVKGDARLNVGKEGIQVRLAGKVADSQVKAHLTAAGFAAPVYTFAVDLDQLDLDRYAAQDPAAHKAPGAASPDPGRSLLAPFEDLPASGTLTIGVLTSSSVKASNVKLVVK